MKLDRDRTKDLRIITGPKTLSALMGQAVAALMHFVNEHGVHADMASHRVYSTDPATGKRTDNIEALDLTGALMLRAGLEPQYPRDAVRNGRRPAARSGGRLPDRRPDSPSTEWPAWAAGSRSTGPAARRNQDAALRAQERLQGEQPGDAGRRSGRRRRHMGRRESPRR